MIYPDLGARGSVLALVLTVVVLVLVYLQLLISILCIIMYKEGFNLCFSNISIVTLKLRENFI